MSRSIIVHILLFLIVLLTSCNPGNSFVNETSDPSSSTTTYPYDFGDAPSSYGTLISENGAQHTVDSNFHLGTYVDGEADAQVSLTADGDDINGTDDDDGVVPEGPFSRGSTCSISVTAVTDGGATGLFNLWIDFNGNGDWSDAGEQVFTDQSLTSGVNSLSINIPTDAIAGTTFMRARLTTEAGINSVGIHGIGEVEDYQIQIQ